MQRSIMIYSCVPMHEYVCVLKNKRLKNRQMDFSKSLHDSKLSAFRAKVSRLPKIKNGKK